MGLGNLLLSFLGGFYFILLSINYGLCSFLRSFGSILTNLDKPFFSSNKLLGCLFLILDRLLTDLGNILLGLNERLGRFFLSCSTVLSDLRYPLLTCNSTFSSVI